MAGRTYSDEEKLAYVEDYKKSEQLSTINEETGEIEDPTIGEIPDEEPPVPEGFYHVAGTTKASDGTYYEPSGDGLADTTEAEMMYKSVKDNKGFYIGRFEVGNEGATLIYDEANLIYKWEGESKAVVKKNTTVYNYIKWGISPTNEKGGLVELARNFDTENGYTSVTSTLCYGVQWDAALNFIDPNYITNRDEEGNPTCVKNSYVRNSTGKGNYNEDENTNEWEGYFTTTGKIEDYAVKNICDMAGNVREWTMETHYSSNRVICGGCYAYDGSNYPASILPFVINIITYLLYNT